MSFPHLLGLLPTEIAFLCEMELVNVVPRQRLEKLDLLGGPTKPLLPPSRSQLPLWLALLLKRQKRVNISSPPWLNPESLSEILELETKHFQDAFSPAPTIPVPKQYDYNGTSFQASTPFLNSFTIDAPPTALPYHWFELSEMLLDVASDDLNSPDDIRRLLRDIREVRLAKMRKGMEALSGDGEGIRFNGVGAMELSESRVFLTGVIDNLRKLGASREQARREREAEERENGRYREDDEDDDMT